MKFLIALLIAIPTLIAALLFTVAGFSYNNPTMLAATTTPAIATLCIIAVIIMTIPLVVAIVIGLSSLFGRSKQKNKEKEEKR